MNQQLTFPTFTFCHTQSATQEQPYYVNCSLNQGPGLPPLPCPYYYRGFSNGDANLYTGWNYTEFICLIFNNDSSNPLRAQGAGLGYSLDITMELGIEVAQVIFSVIGSDFTSAKIYQSSLYMQPSTTLLALHGKERISLTANRRLIDRARNVVFERISRKQCNRAHTQRPAIFVRLLCVGFVC